MNIDPRQTVVSFHPSLNISDDMPPKAAIGAFFTLLPEPVQILVSRQSDGASWTILGRDACGLVIATSSADREWDYAQHGADPESATVTARWVPFSEVSSVGLVEVERFTPGMIDDGSILGYEAWEICVGGRVLVFRSKEMPKAAQPEEFFRAVIAARSA
jgi:hypothetical protein